MQNINFDSNNFCPNMIDKSTPLKKYLYCTKIKGLCKMVTYFPSGQIIPKKDVKNTGCPYGYVIQDIKKNQVTKITKRSNVLDDISMKEDNKKEEPKQTQKSTKKETTKKETESKKQTNTKKKINTKKKQTTKKKKNS